MIFWYFDIDMKGGMAIVNGMKKNYQLRVVILSDNKVGDDVITYLAGRVRGSLSELCQSLLTSKCVSLPCCLFFPILQSLVVAGWLCFIITTWYYLALCYCGHPFLKISCPFLFAFFFVLFICS